MAPACLEDPTQHSLSGASQVLEEREEGVERETQRPQNANVTAENVCEDSKVKAP